MSSSDLAPPRRRRAPYAVAPWLFLAPGLLLFAVYVIAPIGQSIWISFHDWDGLAGASTLEHRLKERSGDAASA